MCDQHSKDEHQNFGLCPVVHLCCGTVAVPLVTKQGSQGLLVQSTYSLRVNLICFLKSISLTGYNLEGGESFICLGFCLFD